MADIEPKPTRRRIAKTLPLPDCVALVLQGGGALGSFQAGVFEALAESEVDIDWVAGISIGAVNAAIIAGNPPERRVERLRAFWELLTSGLPSFPIFPNELLREFLHEWSAGAVIAQGVPGFFRPRVLPPSFASPGSCEALSFYDSTPLKDTLDSLIDWDLANEGPIRLSVGAVEIESGNFRYFDSHTDRIDARHIMASGALPPGLPPIDIDGKLYWDGGLVSNTPLTHVMDYQDAAMLVFQVDLFSATSDSPRTMTDVINREKEIRYSSRTRQVSSERLKLRQEREAIRRVLDKLPAEMRDDPDVVALKAQAAELPVALVHLIHRANAWEGGSRDFEFSQRTMREHWQAGRDAIDRTMEQSQVMAANIVDGRSAAFDLTRR
ncbi:patatin-like phospholipase family protein [Sphingomonas sp. 37zxx]|uniref:patatin-like phospholipase family protein n=1 Tax=Sphingomonas sp. 37zxx TaxID=1550073 RepID=UPI00053BDD68|nr:patatin-like phospholipase family protein [Sphingomonas sp. 37zxx]